MLRGLVLAAHWLPPIWLQKSVDRRLNAFVRIRVARSVLFERGLSRITMDSRIRRLYGATWRWSFELERTRYVLLYLSAGGAVVQPALFAHDVRAAAGIQRGINLHL